MSKLKILPGNPATAGENVANFRLELELLEGRVDRVIREDIGVKKVPVERYLLRLAHRQLQSQKLIRRQSSAIA